MDDQHDDDAAFSAALDLVEKSAAAAAKAPQRNAAGKVVQPKPQALPQRSAPSSILVSTRQKGNPILNYVRNVGWEYSDIPADYVLGNTTCALFLSLKYHRLHPEYIYSRIRALGHMYNLRVLLTMVDIENHEESLKELSKTSLVNNLTLMLCWSAQEAGHYLELYKSHEHSNPSSIKAQAATGYSDKLVEFITVPRSINKTDALGLVSNFGSVRAAVNAQPEEISLIAGWGDKKVQRWCTTVREPFRVRTAIKKGVGLNREESSVGSPMETADGPMHDARVAARLGIGEPMPLGRVPNRQMSGLASTSASATPDPERRPPTRIAENIPTWEPGVDEEEALLAAAEEEASRREAAKENPKKPVERPKPVEETLSDGVAAALAKLREK